jgi:hypothetical protein
MYFVPLPTPVLNSNISLTIWPMTITSVITLATAANALPYQCVGSPRLNNLPAAIARPLVSTWPSTLLSSLRAALQTSNLGARPSLTVCLVVSCLSFASSFFCFQHLPASFLQIRGIYGTGSYSLGSHQDFPRVSWRLEPIFQPQASGLEPRNSSLKEEDPGPPGGRRSGAGGDC